MRSWLKAHAPKSVRKPISDLYWWNHNRGRHVAARIISPLWYSSSRRLREQKGQHHGERCFILGNGPSLRQTDLSKLGGEFTFGLNRIYLLFPQMGFSTSCLVSVNDLVLAQCADELRALQLPRFVTWRARKFFTNDPQTTFLDTDYTGQETFATDVTGRVFEGFTVTYVALQLAFHLGFSEVILVGVDHNFATQGPANETIISQGADLNHFSPDYFGKGFKWQLPDLAGSERAYRLAKQAYEADGRRIWDATIGGKLTVFPKVDFGSLF